MRSLTINKDKGKMLDLSSCMEISLNQLNLSIDIFRLTKNVGIVKGGVTRVTNVNNKVDSCFLC